MRRHVVELLLRAAGTLRRHDSLTAVASSRDVAASRGLTAVACSRDVAASRNFNCCCEQQRRCGVT